MGMTQRARIGFVRTLFLGITSLVLVACGGGGDDGGSAISVAPAPVWVQGTYAASSTYAAQCAAPRTGIDPTTNAAYVDKQGSVLLENFWLRSWTHEYYLWYREVVDRNPASDSTTAAYFDTQKTTAITSSGKPKDQFHFTYATAEWIALSQSGVSAGYGLRWAIVSGTVPRIVQVAYTEPNSPATNASLTRGAKVLSIDGISIDSNTSSGIATLNAGLSPANTSETHSFVIQELNGTQRTISMTSASVTSTPVQNVKTIATASGNVGYMLFNSHLATSEQQLITAFTQLQQANVVDLVLDLRYNGGGYLAIASEVAYMIAGSTATSGKTFERTLFNDQYPSTLNPVTGGTNTPTPFYATSRGFSATAGSALPSLNLTRVFVITGSDTCSASESVINGLRGAGMTVIQIGATTCGKPYGYYARDNCGTTYFSIQFQGVNNMNFGDYADGFSPANISTGAGVLVPGCAVADDLSKPLGDATENRLEAALYYQANNTCSPAISLADRLQIQQQEAVTDANSEALTVPSEPWRDNRILDLPGEL